MYHILSEGLKNTASRAFSVIQIFLQQLSREVEPNGKDKGIGQYPIARTVYLGLLEVILGTIDMAK